MGRGFFVSRGTMASERFTAQEEPERPYQEHYPDDGESPSESDQGPGAIERVAHVLKFSEHHGDKLRRRVWRYLHLRASPTFHQHESGIAAGELRLERRPEGWVATDVSKQSTGYGPPDASCWDAVSAALDALQVAHPDTWTTVLQFRKCASCGEINIVKDGWLVCSVCEADLPGD